MKQIMVSDAVVDLVGTHDELMKTFGCSSERAWEVSEKLCADRYGVNFEPLRAFMKRKTESISSTGIAKALGIVNGKGTPDPAAVNRKLTELGLQHRVNGQWTLTEKGRAYGENKPFTRNGHSGYVINWHESVLEVME